MHERNRITVFFSENDSKNCHNVHSAVLSQLKAAKRANPGELNYTIDAFGDWDTAPAANHEMIRKSLSYARVVVVLEGSDLLASTFVQSDDPPVQLLDVVRGHGGVVILRVAIRPVLERLIPPALKPRQTIGDYRLPLSNIVNDGQREMAIGVVVDGIATAYQNWRADTSVDEFGERPPVVVNRSNLIHPITVFPDEILRWVDSDDAQELLSQLPNRGIAPGLRTWLNAAAAQNKSLTPPWLLSTGITIKRQENSGIVDACARIEQQAARLYPRHRDAYHCLYAHINDSYVSEFSLALAERVPSEFTRINRLRSLVQSSVERELHFQHILMSLLRKHSGWCAAINQLSGESHSEDSADQTLKEYLVAWQCIPLCQLAILQRHYQGSWTGNASASLGQCLLLLDRICHWLKATNRLMNSIEGVPDKLRIGDLELWTA